VFEGEEGAAAPVAALLDQLCTTVDALIALDLTRLSRDELLELLRGVETQRRRLPVVDHVSRPGEFGGFVLCQPASARLAR